MACKKCDPHELCEECPEWIFTLADLIMCMMGLFVILWVLKPGGATTDTQATPESNEELISVVAAIRDAFGYVPDPASTDPIDMHLLVKKLDRLKNNGPGERGVTVRSHQGAEGTDPDVTSIRQGRQSTVGGRVLFAPRDAALTPQAAAALDQIAGIIRGHRNLVLVKGHASLDEFPESATAQQRMDLSLRRAQAAADYLVRQGVSPDILRVQGCSTFEPLLQRAYTAETQQFNRRVEVEATSTIVSDLLDPAAVQPAEPPR